MKRVFHAFVSNSNIHRSRGETSERADDRDGLVLSPSTEGPAFESVETP
jgi:hypothetical protein